MDTLDGQLIAFRTAWLRAVVRAWSDQEFRSKLLDPDRGIEALEDGHYRFKWPWKEKYEGEDGRDKEKLIIDFAVTEADAFQWVGEDWVFPDDNSQEDQLELYLPISPEGAGVKPEQRALALADYYSVRPSIFGTTGGGGSTPRGTALVTSAGIDLTSQRPDRSIQQFLLADRPIRFGGKDAPPAGFIPPAGDFLEFEVVLLSALARAWDNESFAMLLDATPAGSSNLFHGKNLRAVLGSIRGFVVPFRLSLSLRHDSTARWDPEKGWRNLSPHKLTLNLPAAPVVRDQSIALAAYNSLGAEYPFSCCA